MATIADTQGLKPGQIDLTDSYVLAAARKMEQIRTKKKAGWSVGPNRNSHLWGAVGEIFVCGLLGVTPDWEQKDTDEGIDGTYQGGVTFDVKVSTFGTGDDPHLKLPVKAKYSADIYILVYADLQGLKAEVVGWATVAEIKKAPVKNYKPEWQKNPRHYPDNYVLTSRQLHPLSELIAMAENGTINSLKSIAHTPEKCYTDLRSAETAQRG